MGTPTERPWSSLAEVLHAELSLLRDWDLAAPKKDDADKPQALREAYDAIAKQAKSGDKLSAICLSGGGIRSATFNLGVLQALARVDLLDQFDYLSTVSGGGYIGSWLQAWIQREREERKKREKKPAAADGGTPPMNEVDRLREADVDPLRIVMTQLCRPGRTLAEKDQNKGIVDNALAPEPEPIDRLREFSNYLTPRKGLFSADTWTIIAIVLRNLLLNWLVIVPVIAAALMIPQMAYLLARSHIPGDAADDENWAQVLSATALGLGFISSVITHWLRGEKRSPPLPKERAARRAERRRRRRRQLLAFASIFLLVSAATLLVLAALWVNEPWQMLPLVSTFQANKPISRLALTTVFTIGLPVIGMIAARVLRSVGRKTSQPRESARWGAFFAELFAFVVSGFLASLLLLWLMGSPWTALRNNPPLLTILALPTLLVIYALARTLVTGLMSPFEDWGAYGREGNDSDREWWARMTGRVLMVVVGWIAFSGLVLLGTWLFDVGAGQAYERLNRLITGVVAAVGTLAGVAAGLLGKSGDTSSGHSGPKTSPRKELVLKLAAPATVISVIMLLALGTAWLGRIVSRDPCFLVMHDTPLCPEVLRSWDDPLSFLELFASLIAIGLVAGFFVNVNRFSLHAMYRNRLVRAYLGASNIDRRPNSITGFDEDDGRLPLAELQPSDGKPARLFPIVNVTLNLLAGERLAWQERRAESFSMTPLYCGNFYEGYRQTELYGRRDKGISLATAMAISGAAANPNMGYVSTPALTFLMALLNARLGVWLPNTNESGGQVNRAGPLHATSHLLSEMFGLTTRYASYVNLSDGGHFENLGLYEVVLRRCRFVIVSDAGCDPEFGFGDLGNAIAKIRIDFGIPIEFQREVEIRPRGGQDKQPIAGLYCAIATIGYSVPDGGDKESDGTLVYLKPTLAPRPEAKVTIPYDVQAYANTSPKFPHEPTADQWFSERQFESYRALGAHLVGTILGSMPLGTLDDLEQRMRQHVPLVSAMNGQALVPPRTTADNQPTPETGAGVAAQAANLLKDAANPGPKS